MQFMYVHHALSLKTAGAYVLLYAHITRNTHSYSVHAHKLASQHGAHCSLSYPDLAFLRRLHQQLVSEATFDLPVVLQAVPVFRWSTKTARGELQLIYFLIDFSHPNF